MTEVSSPLLAQWEVRAAGGRRVLDARLREPTAGAVEFASPPTDGREAGRLDCAAVEPLDVAGSVTVFRLALEDRLRAERIAAEGSCASTRTCPRPASETGNANSGGSLPTVAAWYAPQTQYALHARFVKPPAEMAVTGSLLLIVSDQGQEILGGLSIEPQAEKRFTFDLSVPSGWQVTEVKDAAGGPLAFEQRHRSTGILPWSTIDPDSLPVRSRHRPRRHGGRAAVSGQLPRPVWTPPDWMADWPTIGLEFPAFAVLGASAVNRPSP